MLVCFHPLSWGLMGPFNLEIPVFQFWGYFLISLINPSLLRLPLSLFGNSVWTLNLLRCSFSFLHFSLLFFIFLLIYFLRDFLLFYLPILLLVPSPIPTPIKLFKSSSFNQCSLCTACCCSFFRVAVSSLISLCILMIFTLCFFSGKPQISWSCIFLLFAFPPQIIKVILGYDRGLASWWETKHVGEACLLSVSL